ncbi:MAG: hypothetical protein SPJ65_02865 [Roseburia sp.]|nr:hypothetical protein [Roseburia sp.]
MRIQSRSAMSLSRSRQVRQAKINYRISAGRAKRTKSSSGSKTLSALNTSNNKLSLYDALMKKLQGTDTSSNKNENVTTAAQKKNYTLLKQYATNVVSSGKKLLDESEGSLFDEASKTVSEDITDETKKKEAEQKIADAKDKVKKQALEFINEYNDMIDKMNDISSNTNELYLKQLKQYGTISSAAFTKVGISANKDGTLTVDEAKLKAADWKDLKAVFGEKGSFVDKVTAKTKYIKSSAEYNMSNLSKVYSSSTYSNTGRAYETGSSTFQARG